jgi:hypothetical protein
MVVDRLLPFKFKVKSTTIRRKECSDIVSIAANYMSHGALTNGSARPVARLSSI